MLELNKVSKTFNPGTVNEKKALDGLSVTLAEGDFVTIVGSNGAGKSTFFNAVAGDFFVDEGSIRLDGADITYLPAYRRSRQIGRLFQDPMRGTAPHMTIEENLALAYLRTAKHQRAFFSRVSKADKAFFREQLARLDMGLEDRMRQPVGLLSGGQRQQFVTSASGLSMPTRYYKYLQELNQGTQPTPSPSPTPSGGGTDEPEQEDGLPVYLSFQCTGGGALDNILDTLEARGIRALFLFTPDALAAAEGQLRRLVGSGHAVGLSVPGQSLDGARAALEEGAGLLEQLVRVRPHTVYLEGAASGVADALEREGWACWSANVDGRPDGRSQSTQANALLRTLEGRRSAARMLLDDSGESAGILSRLLPRMPRDAYWFQLALDTRI